MLDLCAATSQTPLPLLPVSQWKRTPLHLAAQEGHAKLVQTLIEHGAAVVATDMVRGSRWMRAITARARRLRDVR